MGVVTDLAASEHPYGLVRLTLRWVPRPVRPLLLLRGLGPTGQADGTERRWSRRPHLLGPGSARHRAPLSRGAPASLSKSAEPPGRLAQLGDEVDGRHRLERVKRTPRGAQNAPLGSSLTPAPFSGCATTWTSSKWASNATAKRAAMRAADAELSDPSMPQTTDPPVLGGHRAVRGTARTGQGAMSASARQAGAQRYRRARSSRTDTRSAPLAHLRQPRPDSLVGRPPRLLVAAAARALGAIPVGGPGRRPAP